MLRSCCNHKVQYAGVLFSCHVAGQFPVRIWPLLQAEAEPSLWVSCNVVDAQAVGEVLRWAREQLPAVQSVVHAAGALGQDADSRCH